MNRYSHQLERWNGFDLLDVTAFAMNAGALEADQALQNRLASRYWQCMENYVSASITQSWQDVVMIGTLLHMISSLLEI